MYIVAGLRNDSAFEPDYPQHDGEYSIAGRFRQFQSAFGTHLTAKIMTCIAPLVSILLETECTRTLTHLKRTILVICCSRNFYFSNIFNILLTVVNAIYYNLYRDAQYFRAYL